MICEVHFKIEIKSKFTTVYVVLVCSAVFRVDSFVFDCACPNQKMLPKFHLELYGLVYDIVALLVLSAH